MALRDTAIIGFAETKIVEKSEVDILDLYATILERLVDQTLIEKDEIDGMILSASLSGAGNCFWSQTVAGFLGLELDLCQSVDIGGSSPLGSLARACAAIDAGLANVVLLLFADTQVREMNARMRSFYEFVIPYGLIGAPAYFGLISSRYEHQFGLDYEALGKLAVTQRAHALLNDNACEKLRAPITVEDYLGSRMISQPIRLLDCVMPCDGASGLLLMNVKRARQKGVPRFAVPIGYGERTNFRGSEPLFDPTESGHAIAGERAFRMAGLRPKDIACIQAYDDFVIAILLQMEMLGLCGRGQGCAFIDETDFSHAGDLPLNTGGGQLSAGQTGLAGGGTVLVEAVRQLFGEGGRRQMRNVRNVLVTGLGGLAYARNWDTSNVAILVPDA